MEKWNIWALKQQISEAKRDSARHRDSETGGQWDSEAGISRAVKQRDCEVAEQ
jgi:hypothetical protein